MVAVTDRSVWVRCVVNQWTLSRVDNGCLRARWNVEVTIDIYSWRVQSEQSLSFLYNNKDSSNAFEKRICWVQVTANTQWWCHTTIGGKGLARSLPGNMSFETPRWALTIESIYWREIIGVNYTTRTLRFNRCGISSVNRSTYPLGSVWRAPSASRPVTNAIVDLDVFSSWFDENGCPTREIFESCLTTWRKGVVDCVSSRNRGLNVGLSVPAAERHGKLADKTIESTSTLDQLSILFEWTNSLFAWVPSLGYSSSWSDWSPSMMDCFAIVGATEERKQQGEFFRLQEHLITVGQNWTRTTPSTALHLSKHVFLRESFEWRFLRFHRLNECRVRRLSSMFISYFLWISEPVRCHKWHTMSFDLRREIYQRCSFV